MSAPKEVYPPDEIITAITIHAALNVSQSHADGTWSVHCPEWKYHGHGMSLTRIITLLVAEIETHNNETLINQPAWYKNPKQLAECALGMVDHQARQAELLKRRRRPIPDDGKRTPGAFWQLRT